MGLIPISIKIFILLQQSLHIHFWVFLRNVENLHSLLSIPAACTVEPVLKDYPIGHENVVFQDRWSLVTGSIVLKI